MFDEDSEKYKILKLNWHKQQCNKASSRIHEAGIIIKILFNNIKLAVY